jgi:hypothetical protein
MLLESKDLDMDGYIMHMHGLLYFHLRLTVWVRIGIDGLGFHSPPPPLVVSLNPSIMTKKKIFELLNMFK